MPFEEKLVNIRTRLGFTKKQFCILLNINKKNLEDLENGIKKPSEKIIKSIENVFGITKNDILDSKKDNDLLIMTKKIEVNNYKNLFSAYAETLKLYFSDSFEIYVLSKIKYQNKMTNIFNIFFKNNKKSVINEMKMFTPSYLAKKNKIHLLINIENDFLKVYELGSLETDEQFIFNNYKYRKANKINLK